MEENTEKEPNKKGYQSKRERDKWVIGGASALAMLFLVVWVGSGYWVGSSSKSTSELDELPKDYVEYVVDQVGGDRVEKRLAVAFDQLNTVGSGNLLRASFPDLQYLLEWIPAGKESRRIFPFFYYYSLEADTTFLVSNIDRIVAICDGLQNSVIVEEDLNTCTLAEQLEKLFF